MLYTTPEIKAGLQARLGELDELRSRLGSEVSRPVRWMGSLRRLARADVAASSTEIEGFELTTQEALGVIDGSLSAENNEDRLAVACYARAMDHVGVMAEDLYFAWHERVILDLHFDACSFQRDKGPGLIRTTPIGVSGPNGVVYRAPDADELVGLLAELVSWLGQGDLEAPAVVRAAMAHLHLVSIHPFADGNGRISRILQSLVLAREQLVSPEFSSIEAYLGDHTSTYYDTLKATQAGSYRPERDATAWVEFCVEAHIDQAASRLGQIQEAGRRWGLLEELVARRGWPDRLVIALEQSLLAGADRAGYAAEAEVANPTATGDLRRLADAGLVVSMGGGRSTRYLASDDLREAVRDGDT